MCKNNATIEELERQYNELGKMINKRKQEEENAKRERLAKEQESRRLEIADKQDEVRKLIAEYIKDYGSYYYESSSDSVYEFPYLYHMFF